MNITMRYTIKKAIYTIPILIGISLFAFTLGLLGRGDPALMSLTADPNYIPTDTEIAELRAEMGIDDPVLIQYGRWLGNAMTGDLGNSYIDDKPVYDEIMRLLPNTLIISSIALVIIIVSGISGGVLLVMFHNKFIDIFGRSLLVFLMSIPGFCIAYFMIWLFSQTLKILPTSGVDGLTSFVLPCIVLSMGASCLTARLLRSSLLGNLNQNYILTARAKGISFDKVILFHALKNSIVPSVTYMANAFGGFLGGSMIIESIFSIPGIGSYALAAIGNRDYIAIQGYVLFTGFVFVVVSLIADIICSMINPQISLGG